MEVINTRENEQRYKDFDIKDSFRIVIYSFVGILIFFIPFKFKSGFNTIIYQIYFFIHSKYVSLIKFYLFIMVVVGSILPIVKSKKTKYCPFNNILKCIRPISILFILIIFSRVDLNLLSNKSLLFMERFLIKFVIMLSLSSIFLPLITNYGLLEVFEAYFQKCTKKTFKLSGKCVLNIMIYLFVDVFSGMFMTNMLYKNGRLRQSEACILITCFSFSSFLNYYYLSEELSLKSLTFTILCILFLSLFINFVVCRLWPLNSKKKSYLYRSSYKECNFKRDKFKKAIIRYLATKKDKKLIYSMVENFKQSFNIIMTILPDLVIIIFIGELLIDDMGLVKFMGKATYPIIDFLGLPSKNRINEAICLGMFNGGRYIEFINKDNQYITNLIIFIISMGQTISISTNMLYIDITSIPIKKIELFIIGLEKILISIIIICLFHYLVVGNL